VTVDTLGKQINNPSMSFDAHAPRRPSLMLALALVVAGAAACGGSDDPRHPDTGYGADQPVPATVNCTDLCTRGADCGAELCNEDTMSTMYTQLAPLLTSECQSECNDTVLAQLTAANWQCYFTSSCRQVFGENVCQTANTKYTCN
jgi:hypothetical protein